MERFSLSCYICKKKFRLKQDLKEHQAMSCILDCNLESIGGYNSKDTMTILPEVSGVSHQKLDDHIENRKNLKEQQFDSFISNSNHDENNQNISTNDSSVLNESLSFPDNSFFVSFNPSKPNLKQDIFTREEWLIN